MSRLTLYWFAGGLALMTLFTVFIGFPWFINQQNDGAIGFAFIWLGVVLSADYLFIKNCGHLFAHDDEGE